jgi:hypothetical protein
MHSQTNSLYEDDFETVSKSRGHKGDANGDSYSMNFDQSAISVTVSRHDEKFTCPDCAKRIPKGKEFVHKKICKGAAGSGSSGKR